jgi:predicted P-loop ATPase
MRNLFFALSILFLALGVASAKDAMQGTLVSENSVQCGAQTKGKKSTDIMCQEYVIRTATTEYHVRQEKEGHKEMLPVNAPVELTISKDRMKFKVNGKSYEMLITSETAAPAGTPAAAAAATAAAPK